MSQHPPRPPLPAGITELPKGVNWTPKGWRASMRHARQRFPPATPLADVLKWRDDERARQQLGIEEQQHQQARPRIFDEDVVDEYLPGCIAMPTYRQRVRDMELWREAIGRVNGMDVRLGDLPSNEITAQMVRTVCARWKMHGPRSEQYFEIDPATGRRVQKYRLSRGPLSAGTVNKRKRALENFFTVKNGRRGDNPVHEVEEFDEDEGEIRSLPIGVLRQIVDALRDEGKGRGLRVGNGRFCHPTDEIAGWCRKEPPTSKTKARIRVMVETGLPQAQLKLVKPEHVHHDTSSVWVSRRKKGKGVAAQEVPVSDEALDAFRALAACDGFGHFSNSSVGKAWQCACRVVEQQYAAQGIVIDLSKSSPYSARHSFATDVVNAMQDTHLAGKLLLHGNVKRTTERYARAAIDPILAAAVQKVAAQRNRQAKAMALPRPKPVKVARERT